MNNFLPTYIASLVTEVIRQSVKYFLLSRGLNPNHHRARKFGQLLDDICPYLSKIFGQMYFDQI